MWELNPHLPRASTKTCEAQPLPGERGTGDMLSLSLQIPGCAPPRHSSFSPVHIIHVQLNTSGWDLKLFPSFVSVVSDSWLLLAPAVRAKHSQSPACNRTCAERAVAWAGAGCLARPRWWLNELWASPRNKQLHLCTFLRADMDACLHTGVYRKI